jgi:hypothetical protein
MVGGYRVDVLPSGRHDSSGRIDWTFHNAAAEYFRSLPGFNNEDDVRRTGEP